MNLRIRLPAALVVTAAIFTSTAGIARAQSDTTPRTYGFEPPRRALELTVGTGYTQGFGLLYRGVGLPSVANEGIAFDFGLGYRFNPHFMLGATGEYQEFDAEHASEVRGVTAGLAGAYHLLPAEQLDPWIQVGAGYRWLWQVNDGTIPTVNTQGLEAGKLSLGLDVRVSREVSIAPVIGADIDVFLIQDGSKVSDARTSTFVHAGLQGRFDLGGTTRETTTVARDAAVARRGSF